MTAPTTAGGAVLPVVGYADLNDIDERTMRRDTWLVESPCSFRKTALTAHAPAQAEIDTLRAENERLRRESSDWQYSAMHNLRRRLSALGERNTARAELAALKAAQDDQARNAGRWNRMARVFHLGEFNGALSRPATMLKTHWMGWALGRHQSVNEAVDALITEESDFDATKETP